MDKVVANTSPLIFSSKVEGLLEILNKFFEEILIPEEVYEEAVVRGLESDRKEVRENAQQLQKLIEKGKFRTTEVKEKEKWEGLGKGESAAISLAKEKNIRRILLDERKGIRIARSQGLEPEPLPSLLIKAHKKNLISKKKAKNLLHNLLAKNYWLSVPDYERIMKKL
ncbi:MAG: hypothetical protein ABEK36_01960 [Candidatus Aenigmatarchaeota archaeon]